MNVRIAHPQAASHNLSEVGRSRALPRSTRLTSSLLLRAAATGASLSALLFTGGCEVDSWLFDQSVVGRWEQTPTIVPVLEKIDVIESDTGDFVDVTQVQRDDLVPQPIETKTKPGDALKISILDYPELGKAGEYETTVDAIGFIDIPGLPRIRAAGRTQPQIKDAIARALSEGGFVNNALVQVQYGQQQDATFRAFGAVDKPGQYRIPGPDYRLLQALTDAGGVSPVVRKVYVIRQVSLSEQSLEETTDKQPTKRPGSGDGRSLNSDAVPTNSNTPPKEQPKAEDIIDVIDQLTKPAPTQTPAPTSPAPAAPPAGSPNCARCTSTSSPGVPGPAWRARTAVPGATAASSR